MYVVSGKGPTLFPCMWIPCIQVSQHCLLKKIVLSPLGGLSTCVKNHLTIYVRICFWALSSVPLVCISVSVPTQHCFDDYSFIVGFEIRKCKSSSTLFFFSRLCWLFGVHCSSVWILEWVFLNLKKLSLGFW